MFNRRQTILLLISAVAVPVGCKGPNSANSRTAVRNFSPPIVAENDVMKAEIRKLHHKRRSFRIWMNLQNKTDDTLQMNYSDITATVDGRTVHGALRIPFVRVTKGFEMTPKLYKTINQPIEFMDLPRMQNVEIKITNIRVNGKDGTPDLSVTLPVRNPPKAVEKN
jgi:hypothetical protein